MRTLKRIKATLYDAEEREIRDCSVKLWLKELRKVAYDAEDVLSEYHYEVTRVQVEARKASEASGLHKREQIEYIVPIPDGIVDRLNKIRSRFDEIAKDREALQLSESDGARRPNNKLLRPPTGHMIDEASIFGRDDEVEEVINLLLSKKEKPFSVISIIGRGGLGKTTIAQLVYKDKGVSRCFDLNGWVCVSEEFDVRRVIKATIESFSKTNCGLSELSQLQEGLEKNVKGKTILLVLDDMWNENRNLWELFRVSFKEARMVRIIVTTRNEKVAKVMETTTCFNPGNLSEYYCWQLFEHYAFSGASYTMPKHLVDMGREITKKCGGLPLAVKSIASLLRLETDEEVWREILESALWKIKESKEEIFPALQISYAHLPAHLKPCFLFCSMYPKDYVLGKMDLIRLWIAHGYIESRRNREITVIFGCSSIRTMQLEQLPSQLKDLIIFGCDHLELITGFGHLDILKRLSICWCKTLKSLTMDGLQLVESTELFGDLSHEIPQINRQSISSLTCLSITYCGSLHLLPDGLIPSGPCDVFVHGCGCPDYYKRNEGFYQSLSDEDIEDELDQLTYDNDCT